MMRSPSLPELQRAFAAAVYADDETVTAHVRHDRFPAARHLQVYRNNVFESLVGALKAVYPVVERLVGAGFFAYAADGYIRRHPPASGNLHDFGGDFAGFLAGFEPARAGLLARCRATGMGLASGISCRRSRRWRLSDSPRYHPGQYGQLRFRLHPSAQLVVSDHPLLRIWEVNQPEYAGDVAVNLADGGVQLLVVRRGFDVVIEPLSAGDDTLLRAFAAGQCFEEASTAVLAAQPDYDLAAALRRHVASAVITDFSITGDMA